jgi:hypothetical protein
LITKDTAGFGPISGLQHLPHDTWDQISSDFLYNFIPVVLRKTLASFYSSVSQFDDLRFEIEGTLSRLINGLASQSFHASVTQIDYYADYINDSGINASQRIPLLYLAVYGKHPKETLLNAYPNQQFEKFRVAYFSRERPSATNLETVEDLKVFDDFWRMTLQGAPKESIAQMWKVLNNVVASSKNLQNTILKRILEPWS